MGHRVETYAGGNRARVVLDLNASLDSDSLPIGSSWVTLKNVLSDLPGVLRKRGAITDAGANSTDINDATGGALAFYDGPIRGTTYRPYFGTCLDGANVETYMQGSASSRVSILTSTAHGLPVSKSPTINGVTVLAGRAAANSTYPQRPGIAIVNAGTSLTSPYSTGTVTMTSGSASVTGSGTTWTSDMEGAFFYVTTDTYLYALYVIKKVVSTTSLILDRNYAGDATGAGLAYGIGITSQHNLVSAGPFGSAGVAPRYRIAASAWSRMVVAWTKEAGSTASVSDSTPEYSNRIRWSGVIGSDDGPSAAETGIYAWDAGGHLDLTPAFGGVLALAPLGDAVLAFQESGLTVLRGAPAYDGAGSLDASEVHQNVFLNGGFAYESTPEGVFFFDKQRGPCVYNGTSIVRLGDKRVTRTMLPYGITAVGYYDGKVVFSGTTTKGLFVFDTATGSWTFHDPPAVISCLIAGRVENDEDLVGLGAGVQVVNVTNMFDSPGVAAADWDSTAITATIKTGKIGDPMTYLRPERAFITYRLTDLTTTNPYLTLTVTTGLPDTSDSEHTDASANTELVETTDVETVELQLNLDRDPMTQVQLAQTNACGKLEIYSVVLDCAVEGDGPSS